MNKQHYIHTFPSSFEEASYIYGALIKERSGNETISFMKSCEGLRPIGGTLRLQTDRYFDTEMYLFEFSLLIQSLRKTNGTLFYTEEQQKEIIHIEKMKDEERGVTAPYFRVFVYNWLKKTGLYPSHITYIGHILGIGDSLTKHLFYVSECITFHNKESVYITPFSREHYVFDKNLAKEDPIGLFDLLHAINNIYGGKHNTYYLLLQILIKYYQDSVPEHRKNEKNNYREFLNKIHPNKA